MHVPEGREVFPLLSVEDNLRMGAFTRSDRDGVAQDMEAVFGYFPILRERKAQEAGQLSGGQQQMLAIARALLARPAVMLMDEPSLGLSPKLTREIFDIVVRINRERGVTILLVEQNAHMALKIADFGYVLEVGRIVMEDTGSQACGKGRYPRILSRHESRRRERNTAVETQEALAMTAKGRRHHPEDVLAGRHRARRAGRAAPEAIRHLAQHLMERVRAVRARGRHGADRARLRAGRMRLGALQHQPRMALRRHGHSRRRRRVERHLSDRRAAQVEYLCSDSATVHLFVEDDEQLDKALEVRANLPKLRKIIVFDMDGLRDFNDPQVMSLDALRALGREHDAAHPHEWERRVALRKADDLAVLIYTSGTTGRPKGAMLSHANLLSAAKALHRSLRAASGRRAHVLPAALPRGRAHRRRLHRVPLRHAAQFRRKSRDRAGERARDRADRVRRGAAHLGEVLFGGADPREGGNAPAQLAYKIAIGIGYKVAGLREEGKPVPAHLAAAFWLARVLVLDNIRKAIGVHRARLLITGAAPISPDLLRWYAALGLEMIEVWGQTESGGISTANPIGRPKPGSIGLALPQTEVKVSPEGELLVRSPSVFMGYLNQPEKTAETLRDGWLHTGDVGRDGQRRLLLHHRPDEGHHHHGGRQEHHALRDREPVEVLALHHRRGGDRRPARRTSPR